MSQEQRTLVAISLMLGLVIIYQAFFAPKRPPEKPVPPPPTAGAQAPQTPKAAPPPTPPQVGVEAPEHEVRVETPTLSIILSTRGAGVKSWRLKDYVVTGKGPVDIVAEHPPLVVPPLAAAGYDGMPPSAPYEVDKGSLQLKGKDEEGTVIFSRKDPDGLRTEKRLRFRGSGYVVAVDLRLSNEGTKDVEVYPKVVWGPGFYESSEKAGYQHPPTAWINGDRVEQDPKSIKAGLPKPFDGTPAWAALHDTYFAAAIIPTSKAATAFVTVTEAHHPWIGLQFPATILHPGQQTTFLSRAYGGPKDLDQLASAAPGLDRLVDLRFTRYSLGPLGAINYVFEFGLARPALYLLRFLRSITGSYGLAIILLTILIKVALFPMTQKSLKSMQAMQALQPKIQAIKEKYKNNPQKRNQEMAELMRRHKVSGAAGCLPMLAQMPVMIALYYALSNSIDLWQAPFLWVKDLSAPEHGLFALPASLPLFGGTEFRPLPLLMGATQFMQMRISPSGADPAQAAMMMYFMPIFMTFIFYGFPSGLVLYWLCFNALQIAQQYLLNQAQARKKLATPPA